MTTANVIREKIKNNENVKEPIKEIWEKIDKSNEQVIVLKGERGSGRTTVLLEKESQNEVGKEISIYNHFESTGLGISTKDVGIDFIKHRYELEMVSVLLHFLSSRKSFSEHTQMIKEELTKQRKLFVYDINSLGLNDTFKSNIVTPGHYTEDLIKEIKSVYNPEKLLFLVDRFDWMFNRSPIAQQCIQGYFKLFDQVVLTTDDMNYSSKYPTIDVDYGNRKEIMKEILRKYIEVMNISKEEDEKIYLDSIYEETIDYILDKANGDIESILLAIRSLSVYSYRLTDEEINNDLEEEVKSKITNRQLLKQMDQLQPKFHI